MLATDGTGLHDRAGRAQGRHPAGDRRALRRQRAAGRVADGHPDRRPRRLGRDGPQRDVGARARRLHRPAAHLGGPGPHRLRATATTSTTSPAPVPSRPPSAGASPTSSPRRPWRWTTSSTRPASCSPGSPRTPRSSSGPSPSRSPCAACTSRSCSRGCCSAVVVMSNGAVEKETVVLDADADRRRRGHRERTPRRAPRRAAAGRAAAPTTFAGAPATAPTRSRRASCEALAAYVGVHHDEPLYVGGASRLAAEQEAFASTSASGLLELLEQHVVLGALLRELLGPGLTVRIGAENELADLRECSLVLAPYLVEGEADRHGRRVGPDAHGLPQGAGRGVHGVAPTRPAALPLMSVPRPRMRAHR